MELLKYKSSANILPPSRNRNNKLFSNISEECNYYKSQYEKYHIQYKSLNISNSQLLKEKNELEISIKKLKSELTNEKNLRTSIENKLCQYTNNIQNENQNEIKSNSIKNDNQEKLDKEKLNIEKLDKEKLDKEKLNKEKSNKEILNKEKSNKDKINKDKINKEKLNKDKINKDKINKDKINKEKLNKEKLEKEKSEKEKIKNNNSERFDYDLIEDSLSADFIKYSKDSFYLRECLYSKEKKLNKLSEILNSWLSNAKILKEGLDIFGVAVNSFHENLINDQITETFTECPDLINLLFSLQNSLYGISHNCKIFSSSLESMFINQIENLKNNNINNIKTVRKHLSEEIYNFNIFQNKFLNQKKNTLKKSDFTDYVSKFHELELLKFDYFSNINEMLLTIKIDIPEILSILMSLCISFFNEMNNATKKLEISAKTNFEKISVKRKLKNKILRKLDNEKNKLEINIDSLYPIAKTDLLNKEGFVFIKENEDIFTKKYAKLEEGNIIYYKLKKDDINSDENYLNFNKKINLNEKLILCDLLLSNVKNNDKENSYPFSFEIINAAKKNIIFFQANNEQDQKEWINTIKNGIENEISNYSEKNNTNKKKQKKLLDQLINKNICADCGIKKPTWLSTNWLTLICIDCSAIHRSLGAQISKIKSLQLDNINIDLLEFLSQIKQSDINKMIEKNMKKKEKIKVNSTNNEKEKFITEKYKEKKFMQNFDQININVIFDDIEKDNILEVYSFLKNGNYDINELYEIKGEKYTLVHHASKYGKLKILKLLYFLGADILVEDSKGLKPIDYANTNNKKEINEFLTKNLDKQINDNI